MVGGGGGGGGGGGALSGGVLAAYAILSLSLSLSPSWVAREGVGGM
jgi:hypothetical protein